MFAVTLIDQRILIDAPPQVVWDYLSDPAKMPSWHAGYRTVSVLTTRQTGPDTRRRCSPTGGGKDVIERIVTWVDGLGYEYEITEGGPYRSLQGRFRLQTSPDGTSVQWTIFYKPKGPLGVVKDRLGGRRQVAEMMAASLRQLRRRIDEMGQRMDAEHRAKVAMQGRLNADERAHYQRRHPASAAAENGAVQEVPVPAPLAPPAASAVTIPSFVSDLAAEINQADYTHTADTEPKPPAGLRDVIAGAASESGAPMPQPLPGFNGLAAPLTYSDPVSEIAPAPQPFVEPSRPLPTPPESADPFARPAVPVPEPPRLIPPPAPVPMPEPEYRRPTPARGIPSVRPTVPPPVPPAPAVPSASDQAAAEAARAGLPAPTPRHDTGEVSIWEVFGVERPSERDTAVLDDLIRTVRKKQTAEMDVIRPERTLRQVPVRRIPGVLGLRLKLALRRAHVRLRRK
jgi:uncharacterized protein YndB with AHSA1/START domain